MSSQAERVQFLEQRLAESEAQNQAAVVSYEQACQVLETKYGSLASAHQKLQSEVQRLQAEQSSSHEAVEKSRETIQTLHSDITNKDEKISNLECQVRALGADKAQLHHLLQQRKKEADERMEEAKEMLQRLDKLSQDNISLRAEVAAKTDAEVQAKHALKLCQDEVKRLEEAVTERTNRMDQLRHVKDTANAALKDQLAEAQISARDASVSLQHLQAKHDKLEARCKELTVSLERTEEQLVQETANWTAVTQGHVREAQALTQINGFLKEEKSLLEDRVRELEAMIPVMQEELNTVKQDTSAKLSTLTTKCEEAEEEAKRSKAHLESVLASARIEMEGGAPSGAVALASTRQSREPPPGVDLSYTKLYMQWEELQEENRRLQQISRRNEQDMDQVGIILQRKQKEFESRNEEFSHLQKAFMNAEAMLVGHADEKRSLEGRLQQFAAQVRDVEARLKAAETDCRDKARQVASLAEENNRLKGKPVTRSNVGERFPESITGEVDAQRLISEELTGFKDIDECLLQNDRLLRALRSVSYEADHNKTLARQEAEERLGREITSQKRQIEQLTEQLRVSKETIVDLENRGRSYMLLLRQQQSENSGVAGNAIVPSGSAQPSQSALQEVKSAFEAEVKTMRADHEDMRAMLQSELKATEEKLMTAMNEAKLCKMQLVVEEERRSTLSADYEQATQQLAEERKMNTTWQTMAMDAQKKVTQELHQAENDRLALHEVKFQLSEANIRREQLQAELEHDREKVAQEVKARHAAEGRQQAAEEAARDAHKRHEARVQQLERDLKASSDEVIAARRDAASVKARLEQVEAILHDPAHGEKLHRVEGALEQAKQRASELELQLASAESKLKASERIRKDAEERSLELDKTVRGLQKRLENAIEQDAPAEESDAGVSTASKEAELALQLKVARSELEFWQTDAAANAAHVRTYKELSRAADEDLDTQRKLLAKEKEAAKEAAANAATRIQELQDQIEQGKERERMLRLEINQSSSEKHALETQLEELQNKAAQNLKHAQDEAKFAEDRLHASQEALDRANAEIKTLRSEVDTLTIQQGDRVKSIQELTSKLHEADAALAQKDTDLHNLQIVVKEDASKFTAEMNKLRDTLQQAQDTSNELREQKEELQKQLEQRIIEPAGGTPGDGATSAEMGTYKRLLSMRATELQKLQSELQVAQIRAERAERQCNDYRSTAADLRTRLDTLQQQQAGSLLSESEHRARMAGLEEMNLIRAANVGLQTENTKLEQSQKELRSRMQAVGLQKEALERRNAELQSQVSSLQQNLEVQTSAAERWRKQASEYINKYGTVDKDTHEEVVRQVESLRKELQAAHAQRVTISRKLKEAQDERSKATEANSGLEVELRTKESALAEATKAAENVEQRIANEVASGTEKLNKANAALTKNNNLYKTAWTILSRPAAQTNIVSFANQLKAKIDKLEQDNKELDSLRKSQAASAASNADAAKALEEARTAKAAKLQKDLTDAQNGLTKANEQIAKLSADYAAAQAHITIISEKGDSVMRTLCAELPCLYERAEASDSLESQVDVQRARAQELLDKASARRKADDETIKALESTIAQLQQEARPPMHPTPAAPEQPASNEAQPDAPVASTQSQPTLKRPSDAEEATASKRLRTATGSQPAPSIEAEKPTGALSAEEPQDGHSGAGVAAAITPIGSPGGQTAEEVLLESAQVSQADEGVQDVVEEVAMAIQSDAAPDGAAAVVQVTAVTAVDTLLTDDVAARGDGQDTEMAEYEEPDEAPVDGEEYEEADVDQSEKLGGDPDTTESAHDAAAVEGVTNLEEDGIVDDTEEAAELTLDHDEDHDEDGSQAGKEAGEVKGDEGPDELKGDDGPDGSDEEGQIIDDGDATAAAAEEEEATAGAGQQSSHTEGEPTSAVAASTRSATRAAKRARKPTPIVYNKPPPMNPSAQSNAEAGSSGKAAVSRLLKRGDKRP